MRYRFRGLTRDTGTPVEGHVEAPTEEAAYNLLSDNNVVTESLRPDPLANVGTTVTGGRPADPGQSMLGGGPQDLAQAIESAFETASRPVHVDDFVHRFRGRPIRIFDREKVRHQVMQIIDTVIKQHSERQSTHEEIRESIATAMDRMFQDTRNLTSKVQQQENAALERQIQRLSRVVQGLERGVANLATIVRSGGGWSGGGGTPRFMHEQRPRSEEQNAVLLEIFETNLTMQRDLEDGTADPAPAASDASPASPASATSSADDAPLAGAGKETNGA